MKIKWREVTWYSKLLAMIIFVGLPFLGFYLGTEFEEAVMTARMTRQTIIVAPLQPGPTTIQPAPSPVPDAQGMHCGGFILGAKECPLGYHCQLGKIADQGGTCIHD